MTTVPFLRQSHVKSFHEGYGYSWSSLDATVDEGVGNVKPSSVEEFLELLPIILLHRGGQSISERVHLNVGLCATHSS